MAINTWINFIFFFYNPSDIKRLWLHNFVPGALEELPRWCLLPSAITASVHVRPQRLAKRSETGSEAELGTQCASHCSCLRDSTSAPAQPAARLNIRQQEPVLGRLKTGKTVEESRIIELLGPRIVWSAILISPGQSERPLWHVHWKVSRRRSSWKHQGNILCHCAVQWVHRGFRQPVRGGPCTAGQQATLVQSNSTHRTHTPTHCTLQALHSQVLSPMSECVLVKKGWTHLFVNHVSCFHCNMIKGQKQLTGMETHWWSRWCF